MPGARNRFVYAGNHPVNLVDPSGMVWKQRSTLDQVQMGLDVLGMAPVVGEPADLLNALIFGLEGRHGGAALSAAAAVPVVGNFGAGATLLGKTAKLADEAVGAVRGRREVMFPSNGVNSGVVWARPTGTGVSPLSEA